MPPRRSPRVTYSDIEATGGAALFVPEEERTVIVNATAAIVWLLCNGSRSATDIASEFRAATGFDPPLTDIDRILSDLVAQRVLVE